jgi:hypothetical protein
MIVYRPCDTINTVGMNRIWSKLVFYVWRCGGDELLVMCGQHADRASTLAFILFHMMLFIKVKNIQKFNKTCSDLRM